VVEPLSPFLWVPAGKEVEETLRIVDAQTQEAAAKKKVVEGEEAIASEKAAAAKAIKVSVGGKSCHSGASPASRTHPASACIQAVRLYDTGL